MSGASVGRRLAFVGEPSFLSTPTSSGMQLFVHTRVLRSGSLACVTVLADADEVHEVNTAETSRRRLREDFERARKDMKVSIVAASGPFIASRIRALFDGTRKVPQEAAAVQATVLGSLGDGADLPHPTHALEPVDDAEARVARSLELHTETEINAILPAPREIEGVGEGVATSGRDGANPDATVDALRTANDAAGDAGSRARMALQLRDTALALAATRRPDRALDAVATAAALEAPEASSGQIPYVFGMFYKFALVQQELRRATAAQRGLTAG